MILASERVAAPVAFRYAWNMLAEPNLAGSAGLPVGACRGGNIPNFFDSASIEVGLAKDGGRKAVAVEGWRLTVGGF